MCVCVCQTWMVQLRSLGRAYREHPACFEDTMYFVYVYLCVTSVTFRAVSEDHVSFNSGGCFSYSHHSPGHADLNIASTLSFQTGQSRSGLDRAGQGGTWVGGHGWGGVRQGQSTACWGKRGVDQGWSEEGGWEWGGGGGVVHVITEMKLGMRHNLYSVSYIAIYYVFIIIPTLTSHIG